MFKRLYARLAFASALLLIAVGTAIGAFALHSTGMFIQELEQRFNRDLARQLLVQRDLVGADRLDRDTIHQLFSHYMHINPAIEIYLLDTQGNILAYEAPQRLIKRRRVNITPIKQFLAGGAPLPILGDDPRDVHRHKVFSAAAFPFEGPPRQYLYVVLGGEAFESVRNLLQESYLARFSLTAIAAVVLFGVLAGAVAFHLLTRRLQNLATVMDNFRDSGFREHQPFEGSGSGDEIDRAGATYNRMATRIIDQVQALEEKDTLRRNLVANVSHDLRTPLATLQGYLETLMLKTGELPVDERQRFLNVAFRQSERLTRLVSELFELAKLDAREARPELEPVAVGELLHDISQQFHTRLQERGLTLRAQIAPDLPLVGADVGMLNRLIDNLMSNAIDHTPDGGTIQLAATDSTDGVSVAVTNEGQPIPPTELAHLFERFYQAPENRSGKGAGLGLAIVKRIAALHGTEVEVHSIPGERTGETTFSFRLKPWRALS